jgi:phage regulator Rha-like protein
MNARKPTHKSGEAPAVLAHPGASFPTTTHRLNCTPTALPLVVDKNVALVDSRIIADQLGTKHRSTFALIQRYETGFRAIDQVRFKNADGNRAQGGGMAERYALLSEDQSIFLLTLSRNSDRVVSLKMRLVQAFRRARDGADLAKDYLPFYHDLHDEVKRMAEAAKAAGSTAPERVHHINLNKLINSALGIEAGQRGMLTPQTRMAASGACVIAQKALQAALDAGGDHHQAYNEAKRQVGSYATAARLLLVAA